MEARSSLPKLLLVDDEPRILSILSRELGRRYTVRTAESGMLGLEALAREPDMAIVLSDMRMPKMNGTAFLSKAKAVAPNAVRLLLTGQCDMRDAIGAINEGCIFRFLEKPYDPPHLLAMLADAAEQHRLIIAERELLELTLRGALKALCDTFAMVNPSVFGIALRVQRLAVELAERVGGIELWQLEIAALLCQLGAMTLPTDLYARRGQYNRLSAAEREMLARVPEITDQLLAPIPRIEPVREIVRESRTDRHSVTSLPRAAAVLRVALDFEQLETNGLTAMGAIAQMRTARHVYEPEVLQALAAVQLDATERIVEVPVEQLLEGMVLASDLLTAGGTLLVARGQAVTLGMLRRLENFDAATRRQVIAVVAGRYALLQTGS